MDLLLQSLSSRRHHQDAPKERRCFERVARRTSLLSGIRAEAFAIQQLCREFDQLATR